MGTISSKDKPGTETVQSPLTDSTMRTTVRPGDRMNTTRTYTVGQCKPCTDTPYDEHLPGCENKDNCCCGTLLFNS